MEDKSKETPERKDSRTEKKGFFTGRLSWWQVVLGLLLVAFLTFGKYQEMVAKDASPPPTAPAKNP